MNKTLRFFWFIFLFSNSQVLIAEESPVSDQLTYQERADKEAFDSCRISAEKGNAEAMGLLGLLYEKGRGTPLEEDKAFQWLSRGAKKGDAAAQNNLGFLYLKGKGVKQNSSQALIWFQKAADQGLASAEENLGLMFAGDRGIPKDYEKAFGWFKKASEQGDLESQTNLAMMYSLGQGGPQDYVQSLKWFYLALRHEAVTDSQRDDLRDNIEWLEKRMKGKEVAQAKKQASAWKPAFPR